MTPRSWSPAPQTRAQGTARRVYVQRLPGSRSRASRAAMQAAAAWGVASSRAARSSAARRACSLSACLNSCCPMTGSEKRRVPSSRRTASPRTSVYVKEVSTTMRQKGLSLFITPHDSHFESMIHVFPLFSAVCLPAHCSHSTLCGATSKASASGTDIASRGDCCTSHGRNSTIRQSILPATAIDIEEAAVR